jgi:RHS repeat-associated protein
VAGGVVTLFFYDTVGHLLEERWPVSSPVEIRDYVYAEDDLMGAVDQGSTTSFAWMHGDHLGTPLAVTSAPLSAPADTVWRASHAPFGSSVIDVDPDGDSADFLLRVRFPGQFADDESALNYNYFRDYDPAIGRYVESDPIGLDGGINEYAYVAGNPITLADPQGLDFWVEGAVPGELGYGQHQSICVGNYWKKRRFCISFGRMSGESNCLLDCKGHVYPDTSLPGPIVFPMFHAASPATDRKVRAYLQSQLGKRRPWDVLGGENCRSFSQATFRHLLSTFAAPPTPPMTKNPPSPRR